MKHIANILTSIRIVLSPMLLFLLNDRVAFFIVFLLCGATDILDGFFARRFNGASALGARLDSAADLVFYLVMLVCLFIWGGASLLVLAPYVLAIVFIRLINIAICAIKFRTFAILHTWGNKATGLLVFISYGAFILVNSAVTFIPACVAAAISALEETVILIKSDKLDPNRKSLFIK